MATDKEITLDVRQMPPWERHPAIFEAFETLQVGDTLNLINDHEPRPLYYQFTVERPGQVDWQSREVGPREWVALIKKIA